MFEFTPKEIQNCLNVAQTFRELYYSYHFMPDHGVISVNNLLNNVRDSTKKNIVLSYHQDSYELHTIYSFIDRLNETDIEICLMSNMTNCWQRFALCKELFHILLDEEDARSGSICDHLQDYRMSMTDGARIGKKSSNNEWLTEFSAMQFLFPYAIRVNSIKTVSSSPDKRNAYMEIAKRFRIPRLQVEEYLSPIFMDIFDPLSWDGKSDERL
jgi:hypothetical protein